MQFQTLAETFAYLQTDRYLVTDQVWRETIDKEDANGCEHSDQNGQFVSKEEKSHVEQKKGVAAQLRNEFTKRTNRYLNTNFKNKSSGVAASFSSESQRELRSRTENTKQNGFTLQDHFEMANQIKELYEDADLIKQHDDTKHHDENVKIKRFLSKPVNLKSGKKAQACITVKYTIDKNKHLVYSLEGMDIKNALEKTRAKGQDQKGDLPNN